MENKEIAIRSEKPYIKNERHRLIVQGDPEYTIRSQRVYPVALCHNPNCRHEPQFTPHDRRQKFCCEQCRINFNNDQRHILNNTVFLNDCFLHQYEKKLKKIYDAYKDAKGYCAAHIAILKYEKINLKLLVEQQENIRTKGIVRWFYEYGTELHPLNHNFFIIHKRKLR